MQRTLVVHYSRTGHTRAVAEAISAALGADLEEIVEKDKRHGLLGWLRSLRQALAKTPVAIEPAEHRPAAYDLVVFGTPVWAGTISAPVRAYLSAHGAEAKRVAFFCTLGGSGGDKTLVEMAQLCGAKPAATLAVTERELRSGALREKVTGFATELAAARTLAAPTREEAA